LFDNETNKLVTELHSRIKKLEEQRVQLETNVKTLVKEVTLLENFPTDQFDEIVSKLKIPGNAIVVAKK